MSDFRAIKQTYLESPGNTRTREVWHPQIKINGRWVFLWTESTRSNLAEADTEADATEMAIHAWRNHIKNRLEHAEEMAKEAAQ